MLLKKGKTGPYVQDLQEHLNGIYPELELVADGDFGPATEAAVIKFQKDNGLAADGIVGRNTWDELGLASTDNGEGLYKIHHLPLGEYKLGPTKKEYCFLHHTAGWHNPFRTIDHWGRDDRGAVATEFVLGGQSIKGNDDTYDGVLVQAFPEGCYGWHLGKNGSQYMHTHSVGIEVNNFGYLKDGKTYAGTTAHESQIVELPEPFKGYKFWHRYSDAQLNKLKEWILFIADRDGIDVGEGLPQWVKEKGAAGFEFNEDAYYGRVKGLLTHTNTRKDKFDMFPQPELLDLLRDLA